MIKTRLTELVGIKYPIIQAGMGPFPVTSLCIAASNAGCLGLCSTFGTTSRKSNPVVFEDFCKQAHAELSDDDVNIFKKMFMRIYNETNEGTVWLGRISFAKRKRDMVCRSLVE